jgi:hypothetical protein
MSASPRVSDPKLRGEALLEAGDLYDSRVRFSGNRRATRYVTSSQSISTAMQTRFRSWPAVITRAEASGAADRRTGEAGASDWQPRTSPLGTRLSEQLYQQLGWAAAVRDSLQERKRMDGVAR